MTLLEQALKQIDQIQTFCDYCDRLPMPPITVPTDPVGAAGIEPNIWFGLGIVGIYAAIDAFSVRKQTSGQSVLGWQVKVQCKQLSGDLYDILKEINAM